MDSVKALVQKHIMFAQEDANELVLKHMPAGKVNGPFQHKLEKMMKNARADVWQEAAEFASSFELASKMREIAAKIRSGV